MTSSSTPSPPIRDGTNPVMNSRTARRPFVVGVAVGAIVLGAVALISVAVTRSGPESAPSGVSPLAQTVADSLASVFDIPELEAQSRSSGNYRFLPNRRNMWVINRRLGRVVHFRFLDSSKGTVERSHVAQIDQDRFPVRDAMYKISERNITELLWVCNRRTGDFQLWRRNVRDGRLVTDDQSVEAAAYLRSAVEDSRP